MSAKQSSQQQIYILATLNLHVAAYVTLCNKDCLTTAKSVQNHEVKKMAWYTKTTYRI